MTVFISHSFDDKPEFENIADALTAAGVPHWDPITIKTGKSLRDQLRDAVSDSNVCIFIATHRSVTSAWCGAELGAFWGLSKPVIVYVADSSLAEEQLPPYLQGDVWERRISKVVAHAKDYDAKPSEPTTGYARVAMDGFTQAQLEQIVAGAISLYKATEREGDVQRTSAEVADAARSATGHVLRGVMATQELSADRDVWQRRVLWVDDRPDNNVYERGALESLGLHFVLATSTDQAMDLIDHQRFAAVISDMGRPEGPREGFALLERFRAVDPNTPFFIYAGSRSTAHQQEAALRGAQGATNSASELVDMVVTSLGIESSRG